MKMTNVREVKWVKGSELRPEVQQHVLNAFVHRYTKDHIPDWVRTSETFCPVHFASDKDWLEHTFFAVTQRGTLDERVNYCEGEPTWPEGKISKINKESK